jgi:hypothetical protein
MDLGTEVCPKRAFVRNPLCRVFVPSHEGGGMKNKKTTCVLRQGRNSQGSKDRGLLGSMRCSKSCIAHAYSNHLQDFAEVESQVGYFRRVYHDLQDLDSLNQHQRNQCYKSLRTLITHSHVDIYMWFLHGTHRSCRPFLFLNFKLLTKREGHMSDCRSCYRQSIETEICIKKILQLKA